MYSDYEKYSLSLPSDPNLSTGQFSFAPSTGVPVSFSNSGDQSNDNPPPPPPPIKPKPLGPWSTGLFNCFDDVRNCCITCWCPCITFGKIAEIVDRGASSCRTSGALYAIIICVTGCPCCFSCFYRSKMRQQQRLKETPCGDCCVHCWCECCALCQEYRELESRGFDMSIGWQGNVEKRCQGVEMEPIVPEEMSR